MIATLRPFVTWHRSPVNINGCQMWYCIAMDVKITLVDVRMLSMVLLLLWL